MWIARNMWSVWLTQSRKFRKGTGAGYHETKDLLSKEIRFGTIICPRSNIEIISEVFPDFVRVNKQFEMPRLFFRTGPSQIAMIRSTSFYTISETQGLNRMDM